MKEINIQRFEEYKEKLFTHEKVLRDLSDAHRAQDKVKVLKQLELQKQKEEEAELRRQEIK